MSKFKVGDCIELGGVLSTPQTRYGIIKEVKKDDYVYDIYRRSTGELVDSNYSFSKSSIDSRRGLYKGRIKDTKIARKMNQGKIIKEESGYLVIRI